MDGHNSDLRLVDIVLAQSTFNQSQLENLSGSLEQLKDNRAQLAAQVLRTHVVINETLQDLGLPVAFNTTLGDAKSIVRRQMILRRSRSYFLFSKIGMTSSRAWIT